MPKRKPLPYSVLLEESRTRLLEAERRLVHGVPGTGSFHRDSQLVHQLRDKDIPALERLSAEAARQEQEARRASDKRRKR